MSGHQDTMPLTATTPQAASTARPDMIRRVPALILTALLAVLVLPPIFTVVSTSLASDSGAWTLANYRAMFENPSLYRAAYHSLAFALLATLVSLVNGGLMAWLVERTDTAFRSLAVVTAIVSLGTPYIIYVSAWLYLLGRAGPFNGIYRALTGTMETPFNVYSLSGMVFIEGLLWSPLVFLLLSATFRRANADMEEAARVCGASVGATIWRVSLRLAAPAILGVALFVFIRNLEAFDVPVLIGTPGRIELLTTNIYLDMTRAPPELGRASAFSAALMAVVGVLLYFYGRVTRHAERYASVTGKSFRPRPFRLGALRWAGGVLILVNFLIVLILPLLAILWNSLSAFTRPMTLAGLERLTLRHYEAVFSHGTYLRLGINTITISAIAATAAMALTVVAAWMSVRRKPGSALLDQLTSIPVVIPGVVLGVAVLEMSLNILPGLYGTIWIIALAFVIRYMPYGMRYCFSGVMQVHKELEEAAGVAGASQPSVLRRVLLPLLSPSVISGWLFIFLLGAKELSIAILLSGPDSQTFAVAMFDQWANGASGEVSAMGVVWTAVMTVFTVSLFLVNRNRTGMMAGGKDA